MSICPPSSSSDSTNFISTILDGIVDSAVTMASTSENFDITWNNFESRLSRSFANIWSQEQFLDVTLAVEAEDGSIEALQAHKVVLAAASPILRALLEKQSALAPHSPVMLYLQSISARHLGLILEFIYRGRVSLPQDELNDFLGVAKSLQIPLEDIDDRAAASADRPAPSKRSTPQPGGEKERIKRPKLTMGPRSKTKANEVVKIKETFSLKREPNTPPQSPSDSEVYEVVENGYEDPLGASSPISDLGRRLSAGKEALKETFISENIIETDGGFMCNPCDKLLTTKGGVARHVEDLHVMAGVRFQCPKCPYIAKNKNCLHSHVSRQHREIARGLNYEQYALYRDVQ